MTDFDFDRNVKSVLGNNVSLTSSGVKLEYDSAGRGGIIESISRRGGTGTLQLRIVRIADGLDVVIPEFAGNIVDLDRIGICLEPGDKAQWFLPVAGSGTTDISLHVRQMGNQ